MKSNKFIAAAVAATLALTSKAQTEYVELSSNKLFKKSFATYYGDNGKPLDKDLEIGVLKKSGYHWVIYEGVEKVMVILSDASSSYGETERKICINDKCDRYLSEQRTYTLNVNNGDTLKFYYPNYNE
jgi:hypothetical protein